MNSNLNVILTVGYSYQQSGKIHFSFLFVLICNIFHIYFHCGWPALCCFSQTSLFVALLPSSALVTVKSHSEYLSGIKIALSSQTQAKSSFSSFVTSPSLCVLSLLSVLSRVHMWTPNSGDDWLVSECCLGCIAPCWTSSAALNHIRTLVMDFIAMQRLHLYCSYQHLPHSGDVAEEESWMLIAAGSSFLSSVPSPTPIPPKTHLKRDLLYHTCLLHER